jgi:hypothetical protein
LENYTLYQGTGRVLTPITICDSTGTAIAYGGGETLSTVVWPGDSRPASFAPASTWLTPASGTFSITVTSAEMTGLAIGRYQLLTTVTTPGRDPLPAYTCSLDVLAAPGTEAAPPAYTTFDDLLRYGRSWLRQLQTTDDQAGFAEQQHRARTWIEDLAHAHFRVSAMTMVVGSQAMGPRRSGARSTWLQDQLDANALMIEDRMKEACAKKALAYICEGQVGVGESSAAYAKLARMYHSQADYLGSTLTLSLDTNGDGFPDVIIDCTCTDPLYG